jgi:hypothetical protein
VVKTNELPGNESPDYAEERGNRNQPSLSPTEDEEARSMNPSFATGQNIILPPDFTNK